MAHTDNPTNKPKAINRITVSDDLREKLRSLTNQANEALEGITVLSKSDVINYILKDHSGEFSNKELQDIRSLHFNELRFSQWITSQLKTAQARGEAVSFKELISRNLKLLDSPNPKPRKTRTGRKLARGARFEHEASPSSDSEEVLGQKYDPVTEV